MSDKQVSAGGNVRMVRLEYSFKSDPVPERKFELIVTSRSAAKNTRIPFDEQPTIDEMAVMVARTMTNWKNTMQSIIFGQALPDGKLAAIKAVRIDKDSPKLSGIPESDFDPYVTVWNMTNYYNHGLSITIHSYDDGSEALAIAQAHIQGITLFETHCDKLGFIVLNKTVVQGESPTQQTPPQNPPRIGQSADTLPDNAPHKTTQQIQGAYFHAVHADIRATKAGEFEGSITLESHEGGNVNFKTLAKLADKPYDKKEVQYKHGTLVAYPITAFLSVGQWEGKRIVDIPLGAKNYRVFYEERGNREFPTEWEKLVTKLGMADESLTIGLKIELSADYLVVKCDSEKEGQQRLDKANNPVQYKNFYSFYRAENSTKGQSKSQDNAPDLSFF